MTQTSAHMSPHASRPLFSPDPGLGGVRPTLRAEGELPPPPAAPKIQAFEQKMGVKRTDDMKRTPNATGHGAVHMRSFHCRLSDDALTFLDSQINEWLDAHPQFEVKQVTTTIGEFQGKMGKESHLIMTVWV